ncbi:hypothetical protein TRIP_C20850 [Candidatus Zixiibacteriota bacterium]|nr:hypothetical protein TRIP_C20850 [candidate division Zixibacteria bacterium]
MKGFRTWNFDNCPKYSPPYGHIFLFAAKRLYYNVFRYYLVRQKCAKNAFQGRNLSRAAQLILKEFDNN